MAESYSEVVARLASAQKSNKGAPAYSRFVNRPLGRRFAALSFLAGLLPNHVTAISAVFSFVGIFLLALVSPVWWLGPVIGLCLVLGYALDAADGQLARLRGGGSAAGEWLDHMVDSAKIVALHQAVLIALARFTDMPRLWYLVPILYTIVAVVSFFAQLLNEQLRRAKKTPTGTADDRGSSGWLRSLAATPTDYGTLCVVFLFWGNLPIFFAGYALMTLASTGYLGLALIKWYGDMRRLDS